MMVLHNHVHVNDSREWSPYTDTLYIKPQALNSKSIVSKPAWNNTSDYINIDFFMLTNGC